MGPCIVRIFKYISNKMQRYTVYYIWKLLYMFREVLPPIIRSACNCIYSICYLSYRYCYLPLSWRRWNCPSVWQIPDAVDTVACAPDDGWRYHLKHVEQFPDIINCVTLHLVEYKKWPKEMCTLFTHQYLWNKFKWNFYFRVPMPMVATSNTYIESKIQGHFSYQFCFWINTVVTIIE